MRNKFVYRVFLFFTNFRQPLFTRIRSFLLKSLLKSSNSITVKPGVTFEGFENCNLGNRISLNHDCFISAYGGLSIGDDVSIGHRTSIITSTHGFSDKTIPFRDQKMTHDEVIIGSNVWIGANVTILPGVKIPGNTIIAAGSIVTRSINSSISEWSIVGGCPARTIKKI